jgi:hypothetical protein
MDAEILEKENSEVPGTRYDELHEWLQLVSQTYDYVKEHKQLQVLLQELKLKMQGLPF